MSPRDTLSGLELLPVNDDADGIDCELVQIDTWQTKIVDVDREIETSPRRGRSPTKRQANPHLFQSLKAQGYQESDSKSKLVYDFDKGSSSSPSKPLYRHVLSTKLSKWVRS